MSAAIGLFRYAMYRAELAVLEAEAGPLTVTRRALTPCGRDGTALVDGPPPSARATSP